MKLPYIFKQDIARETAVIHWRTLSTIRLVGSVAFWSYFIYRAIQMSASQPVLADTLVVVVFLLTAIFTNYSGFVQGVIDGANFDGNKN